MRVIDLRSDTLTQPTPAMRRAIAQAECGDEQKREDPTVTALERRVAELLGQDQAVFVPSATMANQIALKLLGSPGDELLAAPDAHVFLYELGGPAVHSGLVTKPILGAEGTFGPADIQAAFAPDAWYHSASRVVAFENTHAESGGRAWPLEELRAAVEHARALGLRVHLDGARIMNAAVATSVSPREIAEPFDTVTLCLSKGLACPVGALLAGREAVMVGARRWKQLFGGAMRQAGLLAAAGLFALEHHVDRLRDDHHAASALAARLADAGVPLFSTRVDTNMVLVDAAAMGLDSVGAMRILDEHGVRASSLTRPGILRLVTHLGVSLDDVLVAADRIVAALSDRSPISGGLTA